MHTCLSAAIRPASFSQAQDRRSHTREQHARVARSAQYKRLLPFHLKLLVIIGRCELPFFGIVPIMQLLIWACCASKPKRGLIHDLPSE